MFLTRHSKRYHGGRFPDHVLGGLIVAYAIEIAGLRRVTRTRIVTDELFVIVEWPQ
jgi:hypothetical protein